MGKLFFIKRVIKIFIKNSTYLLKYTRNVFYTPFYFIFHPICSFLESKFYYLFYIHKTFILYFKLTLSFVNEIIYTNC